TEVSYTTEMDSVDWAEMKATLQQDRFDNGRTPEQLRVSFENSYSAVIAYAEGRIIGTVRVLSDGVCNAYVVDVWTLSAYRNRGIARTMMGMIEPGLRGQHIYLFTDDALGFYEKLGYRPRGVGMEKVIGPWLQK
ncbi:MAG: GNAT family N-acetyltransferase, partial [Chloroflexota bacterium]|nr:GNAT family N-acetyltransferase [Chloroflexota bacterium]